MTEKKRKQHYVWKHHLSAWAIDGRIQCLRDGRVFASGLDGVANERDFYRIKELTPRDLFYVNEFAKQLPPPCPELAAKWLGLFQLPAAYSRMYEQSGKRSPEFERSLDTLVNNLEENVHMKFEAQALPIIAAFRARDATPVFDMRMGATTGMYLGLQYLRTPGMMRRMMTLDFDDLPGFNLEAAWGVLRCIWATAIGAAIYGRNEHARVTFLETDGSARFITGDQPIVNGVSLYGMSRDIDLYYPLGPSLAMLLTCDADQQTSSRREVSEDEVLSLNARMSAERHTQLYAADVGDFGLDD